MRTKAGLRALTLLIHHQEQHLASIISKEDGWLVERLMSPFSTKIGNIRHKVLGGDLIPPG